jgi:hypothetical protein
LLVAKRGLEKQPHFHKATWVQSTSVFPAFRSLYMERSVEFVGLRIRCAQVFFKEEWLVFLRDLENRDTQAAKLF